MAAKRTISFLLLAILLIPALSVTAFAADGDGFGFGDIFGAIWNSARDQVNAIGGFFSEVKAVIINGFNAVGDFFVNLGKTITNAVASLLEGLKRLFIPRSDYFFRIQDKITQSFNKKFGGIIYLMEYLQVSFSGLAKSQNSNLLVITFPSNSFFGYFRFDLLGAVRSYLPLVRGALSGFVTLMTVAFAYRRTLSMINT